MANRMEHQVGIKRESVYNTPVTVDRFYAYIDGTEGTWDTRQRQGQGLMVGTRRGFRGDRRVMPIGQGEVTIKAELGSKQFGVLLEAAAGVSAVAAITGGSQMNFHSSIPNTSMPSYTIQLGKVRNNGTVDPETYSGCTAVSFEIECPEDDILTISVTFDVRGYSESLPLAVASYASGNYLFDQSQGAIGLGGTLVAPTTTTLASGLTANGSFRSWTLSVDHQADTERRVVGGRNIPTVGIMEIEFSGDYEYNDLAVRTPYLVGAGVPITLTHSTPEVLGSGFSQLQVLIPQLFLKSPISPPMSDETSVLEVAGDATFDGSRDLYSIFYRTADTAL